jgi:hypothetical protein
LSYEFKKNTIHGYGMAYLYIILVKIKFSKILIFNRKELEIRISVSFR